MRSRGIHRFPSERVFGELGVILPRPMKTASCVCLEVKPVGKPDAVAPHVRFDERDGKRGYLPPRPSSTLPKIHAPLMIQYAENDPRVNASREEYRKALRKNKKEFVMYTYEGTRHGFHNNSTPRYDEAQANIAWERTMLFFKKHLA